MRGEHRRKSLWLAGPGRYVERLVQEGGGLLIATPASDSTEHHQGDDPGEERSTGSQGFTRMGDRTLPVVDRQRQSPADGCQVPPVGVQIVVNAIGNGPLAVAFGGGEVAHTNRRQ